MIHPLEHVTQWPDLFEGSLIFHMDGDADAFRWRVELDRARKRGRRGRTEPKTFSATKEAVMSPLYEVLGKFHVIEMYCGMALRWNNDRSRRDDNGTDPALDNVQQEFARKALGISEEARACILKELAK